MELLFYYNGNHSYLNPEGIQFGGKYIFEFDVKNHKINFEENKKYKPYFYSEGSVLTNITAVVGENGAGKTTMLRAIFDGSKPGVLMIFLENDDTITISNDYGEVSIEYIGNKKMPNIRFDLKYLQRIDYSGQHISRDIHKYMSYVYLSNSAFLKNIFGYSKDYYISKVMLTPSSINEIEEKYYNNIRAIKNDIAAFHNKNYINVLQYNELKQFMSLCIIEYYYFLIANNLEQDYIGKILQDIKLKAKIPYVNTQVLIDCEDGSDESMQYIHTVEIGNSYFELCSIIKDRNLSFINVLYCDLMIEICNVLEIACNTEIDFSDIESIKYECGKLIKQLNVAEKVKKYYYNAFKSINKLYYLIGDKLNRSNKEGIVFSWKDKETYRSFVELIHECLFKDEYLGTFLVEHLIIQHNDLSSGELAMQNFFSWVHALDWFHRIDSNTIDGMKNNILLLIDEIDLYAHPEWQRQILCRLLENVEKQFYDKKVQIIFTTHSPLVLSDMLKNNTIFLSNGKCVKPTGIEETFSNELYSILNNSFFLKEGVIGEFARKKIQSIIEKLTNYDEKKPLKQREWKKIEGEIEVIGDPILKSKLYEMLDVYKYDNDEEENDIENEISMLKKKIKFLESRVEQ